MNGRFPSSIELPAPHFLWVDRADTALSLHADHPSWTPSKEVPETAKEPRF